MTSITTWMRLEPRCRNADMNSGLQGRIYDPLWLLARQWQVGEFEGEDNGSPASATWRGECATLTRYFPGALPPTGGTVEGRAFDSTTTPLETLVERERTRPGSNKLEKLRFAAEAGQQFWRMLDQQSTSKNYRDVFKNQFPFTPLTSDERKQLDVDSLIFLDLMASRVPDGRKLYEALKKTLRPPVPVRPSLPAGLGIDKADVAEVQVAAEAWLEWYESLVAEPEGADLPWNPERMEYAFSVATRMASGEKVLTSREYFSGHLDWHDFNVNSAASLRAINDSPGKAVTRTTIPAPISYKGMPAARFWEFEDAQVDFGAINAGPEDLARMLLVEFAISYGNDWFVIPIELDVGSVCRTNSLVITNTFGERFLIRLSNDSGEPFSAWRMFQLSSTPKADLTLSVDDPNLFLLPPALIQTLESRPVEEVLFLRDEMANMAWGVERVIESATEQPLNRAEQQRYPVEPQANQADIKLKYRLATTVPDYWIPLVPVRSDEGLRLKRGAVLKLDGSMEADRAKGRILNPEDHSQGLSLFEEEIPREGIRVIRNYQLVRWQDGSTHLWVGRRKEVGRGEGSSGLLFDSLD